MKLNDYGAASLREISFWEDLFTQFSGFYSRRESSCCFNLFKTTFNGFEILSQQ